MSTGEKTNPSGENIVSISKKWLRAGAAALALSGAIIGGAVGSRIGERRMPSDPVELSNKVDELESALSDNEYDFLGRTRATLNEILENDKSGRRKAPLQVNFGLALIDEQGGEATRFEQPPYKSETTIPRPLSYRIYVNPIVVSEELSDGDKRNVYAAVSDVYGGKNNQTLVSKDSVEVLLGNKRPRQVVAEGGQQERGVPSYSYGGNGFTDVDGNRFGVFVDFHPTVGDKAEARLEALRYASDVLESVNQNR